LHYKGSAADCAAANGKLSAGYANGVSVML